MAYRVGTHMTVTYQVKKKGSWWLVGYGLSDGRWREMYCFPTRAQAQEKRKELNGI